MSKEFSHWLEEKCRKSGASLRSISVGAGLNPGAVRFIINNPDSQPSTTTCHKLAEYWGVDADTLLALAGHRGSQAVEDQSSGHAAHPEVSYYLRQVGGLPQEDQELILQVIKPLIDRAISEETVLGNKKTGD